MFFMLERIAKLTYDLSLIAGSMEYPDSYNDKMTVEQQENLMSWFATQNRIYKRGLNAQTSHDREVKFYGENLCKRTQHEIDVAIHILETIGIYVGYSWAGHRDEYFLITAQEAENQVDYLYDLEE